MKAIQRVIMVDDDPYSHMICSKIIHRIVSDIELIGFTSPEEGIKYVESTYSTATNDCHTILLLDINMPVMTGWDFLERYDCIDDEIKKQFTIYLLSSSVDHRDKERAAINKDVEGFLMKPFRKEMVEMIFKDLIGEKELFVPLL